MIYEIGGVLEILAEFTGKQLFEPPFCKVTDLKKKQNLQENTFAGALLLIK